MKIFEQLEPVQMKRWNLLKMNYSIQLFKNINEKDKFFFNF